MESREVIKIVQSVVNHELGLSSLSEEEEYITEKQNIKWTIIKDKDKIVLFIFYIEEKDLKRYIYVTPQKEGTLKLSCDIYDTRLDTVYRTGCILGKNFDTYCDKEEVALKKVI